MAGIACGWVYDYGSNQTEQTVDIRGRKVIPGDPELNLNRTYMPLKIGAIAGYIILGMLSASTSMFGILVGAVLRIVGL